MHRSRRRLYLFTLLAATAAAAGARPTSAFQYPDGNGGAGGTTAGFGDPDFQIRLLRREGEGWTFLNAKIDAPYFFNRARCECKEPIRVRVDLTAAGIMKVRTTMKGTIALIAGSAECVDKSAIVRSGAKCVKLGNGAQLFDLPSSPLEVETTVAAIFEAAPVTGAGCTADVPTMTVWGLVESVNIGTPDNDSTGAPKLGIALDGTAPPAPKVTEVRSGNEALTVKWSATTTAPDFEGFAVFCARGGKLPPFPGRFKQYHSTSVTCPAPGTMTPTTPYAAIAFTPGLPATGKSVVPPEQLATLDPQFLCSERTKSTEARISVLENMVDYVVGVAAMDRHGNASPIEEGWLQVPIPTKDFYRGYRDAGGLAEGGCAYGGRAAGLGAGGLLLAAVLVLAARRRRR